MERHEGVLDDLFRLLAVTEEEHRQTDERRTLGPEEDVEDYLTIGSRRRMNRVRRGVGSLDHGDLPTSIVHV